MPNYSHHDNSYKEYKSARKLLLSGALVLLASAALEVMFSKPQPIKVEPTVPAPPTQKILKTPSLP